MARREVTDEDGVVHHYGEVLAGEAMDGGPVMLSWQDVARPGVSANGYNVVIHEFAHKLDLRDGLRRWLPPLPDRTLARRVAPQLRPSSRRSATASSAAKTRCSTPTALRP